MRERKNHRKKGRSRCHSCDSRMFHDFQYRFCVIGIWSIGNLETSDERHNSIDRKSKTMKGRKKSYGFICIFEFKYFERSDNIFDNILMRECDSFWKGFRARSKKEYGSLWKFWKRYICTLEKCSKLDSERNIFEHIFRKDKSSFSFMSFQKLIFHSSIKTGCSEYLCYF